MIVLGNTALTTLLVVGLYLTSTGMVLYNKYMINFCPKGEDDFPSRTFVFKRAEDVPTRCPGLGFPYPLTIACAQFFLHLILGAVLVHGFKLVPMPSLNRKEWWMIHIQGVCVGIFVGLANLSFLFLEASLFEELRQVATVFTLLIGMAFGLEQMSWRLMLVISMIAGGVGLAVAGEASQDGQWLGVIWVQLSCFLTAFSNVLVQVQVQDDKKSEKRIGEEDKEATTVVNSVREERTLLHDDMTSSSDGAVWDQAAPEQDVNSLSEVPPQPHSNSIEINMDEELIRTPILSNIAAQPVISDTAELELAALDTSQPDAEETDMPASSSSIHHDTKKIHPVIILYLHSPASVLALLPFAIALESSYISETIQLRSSAYLTNILFFILLGGVVAFVLQYIHYKLTAVTSAVTLCVVGTCKTVVVIAAGVLTFKNSLSMINILGFSICFLGL